MLSHQSDKIIGAGNTIVQNVHIYNSGHFQYNANHSLLPFGGIYVHYSHGARIEQVYFDDTTLIMHASNDAIVSPRACADTIVKHRK
jgi:hypothetical protein